MWGDRQRAIFKEQLYDRECFTSGNLYVNDVGNVKKLDNWYLNKEYKMKIPYA